MTLAIPLFYVLTKNYYAEDVEDLIEAVRAGQAIPSLDLEEDIINGVMIQFALILSILGIAIILTLRLLSRRLWRPFDSTLKAIEAFRLETGERPQLSASDIREFQRLNTALQVLTDNALTSYRAQKEFTENASHELQTPLAVFQSRLDMLLQQPDITEAQADIIQDLYRMTMRLSQLNRNLLLLAKIDNNQFDRAERIDLAEVLHELLPALESIATGLSIRTAITEGPVVIEANRSLLESMINNLVVNAVRHNATGGSILITADAEHLSVANTSDEPALDSRCIFNRFYQSGDKRNGNGLGLAIVKAICDYHSWQIRYSYKTGEHTFEVLFGEQNR